MGKVKHQPVRTCVACRQEAGKRALVRFHRAPDGTVVIDPSGRGTGRGAYLHGDPTCIELARKRRALERALKAQIGGQLWQELLDMAGKEID